MVNSAVTELLIVKDGEKYIRFLEDGFEYCSMNKASVYPLEALPEVKARCTQIASVASNAQLAKLIISEEPFVE